MAGSVSAVVEAPDDLGPSDDSSLPSLIAAGQETAFAELYDRYGGLALGLAIRVVRDRALAEDAVQEAFLAVWRSAARFRPDRGTAGAWVLTLVHRRAVDLVRRERRRRAGPPVYASAMETEPAADAAWLRAERRRVLGALECLPRGQRRLLELAYYGGLTQSEIAFCLGIPLGTVKSRTYAALGRLRELLGEEEAEVEVGALTASAV